MTDSGIAPHMAAHPPRSLYTAAQVRELDRRAISHGINGFELMQRAATSAFCQLRQRWPSAASIGLVCGTGNNGGDGFVIAALAREAGLSVRLWLVGDASQVQGDAALALAMARRAGVVVEAYDPELRLGGEVIVDALLGIGLRGEPRPLHKQAIDSINRAAVPVLAIDVPSGVCADTGHVAGTAVRADCTVTFIAAKQGLYTGRAPDVCGDIVIDDLQVPASVLESAIPACQVLGAAYVRRCLPRRSRDAHKGHFGHVLVVGGNHGMGGAALMAVEAAARCGAGWVSAATRPGHLGALMSRRPEAMFHALHEAGDLESALHRATVVVCGPGLGQDDWARGLLSRCLTSGLPLVLDADALNLVADPSVGVPLTTGPPVIITPHPGEAARLLGIAPADIQRDRFDAVRRLQARTAAVTVLKGAGTLVADGERLCLSVAGNPGMASAGMGDVLSGVVGALLAQGLDAFDAAACGVWLHGRAGDLAVATGERGLLATDLLPSLRYLVNSPEDA